MSIYYAEDTAKAGRKREMTDAFLVASGLDPDPKCDYTVNAYNEKNSIIGTASSYKNVFKCIAVEKSYQGEGILDGLMTKLMDDSMGKGYTRLFLFTKPENQRIFQAYGFAPIIKNETMLFMENPKGGIDSYLKKIKAEAGDFPGNTVGAIVMNANPFTKGHQYLIEKAAEDCDWLHVFVLGGDAGMFSGEERLSMVRLGCQSLKNVSVHGGEDYLISYATFPDYFLKDKHVAKSSAGDLDLHLFGTYFCSAFGITKRYVGEEPYCETTRGYNAQMQAILPQYGVEVVVIPRLQAEGEAISATRVRRAIEASEDGDLKAWLPATTYDFLKQTWRKKEDER